MSIVTDAIEGIFTFAASPSAHAKAIDDIREAADEFNFYLAKIGTDYKFRFAEAETDAAPLGVREFKLALCRISRVMMPQEEATIILSTAGRAELRDGNTPILSGMPQLLAPRAAGWMADTIKRNFFVYEAPLLRSAINAPQANAA